MTILTINLSLSVFLAVLLPLLDREFCLKNLGGRLLAVCCIAVMARALVPLEFPFSKTIPVSKVLPSIFDSLRLPVSFGNFSAKVSQLLLFLWIAVAVILVIRKIWLYTRLQRMAGRLPECSDEMVLEIMQSLRKKYPGAAHVKVVKSSLNISPLIAGIKNPVILLPEYPFSREEYIMILEHEILHYVRHDIPVKFAADIMCSVYWWNPLFYLLRRKIFELIELGNDRQLTVPFSSDEKAAYMKCLTDTAKKICSGSVPFTLAFGGYEGKVLSRRVHLVGSFRESNRIRNGLTIGILVLLLWGSTSFTLEPYTVPEGNSYIILDKDNCYIIQNGDIYEIYYQNELYITVDSLEYFDSNIPVYQSKGED